MVHSSYTTKIVPDIMGSKTDHIQETRRPTIQTNYCGYKAMSYTKVFIHVVYVVYSDIVSSIPRRSQ